MQIAIEINNLIWNVFRDPASERWIASCDALKQTAAGASWGELLDEIEGLLQDLFTHLLEEGELEKTLLALGWTQHVKLPKRLPKKGVRWDVPFGVVRTATPLALNAVR